MRSIPTTMTAVLLTRHGDLDALAVRDDVAVPRPAPGEVLVRVGAAAVNNTDINTRIGWYAKGVSEPTAEVAAKGGGASGSAGATGWNGEVAQFPRIQGADACGRIVAVGEGVDAARIGERVLVEPVFRDPGTGRVRYFGSEVDGAFAQYACAPARHAHAVRSSLGDAELASFPCAAAAAENMLDRAGLQAGETVLVTGASGGVGSAALQLARVRGASVIAVAHPAKAPDLLALGAARVVGRDQDLVAALGRDHVDVVVDVAGGSAFPSLLDVLRPFGRYAVAGAIAGPVVPLDLRTLYLKDQTLHGCTVLGPGVFAAVIRAIESGGLRPLVAATFALADIAAAQRAFLEKRHTGKIVLVPPASG